MSREKEILRKKYKRIRGLIAPEKRRNDSELIFSAVSNSEEYKKSRVIFVYVSLGSEVETQEFVKCALNDGKRVAVPCCLEEKGAMEAVEIGSIDDLKPGAYGIYEPVDCGSIIRCEDIDLAVIPALSFDRSGVRLGYGGGYYDRYLKNFTGSKLGVAFFECMTDKLPCDEYDIKADIVVYAEEGTVKWQQNI